MIDCKLKLKFLREYRQLMETSFEIVLVSGPGNSVPEVGGTDPMSRMRDIIGSKTECRWQETLILVVVDD